MQISWQLIVTVILALIFLYLLYNAVKITVIFHRSRKNIKTRQKTSRSITDIQADMDDLIQDLKKEIK